MKASCAVPVVLALIGAICEARAAEEYTCLGGGDSTAAGPPVLTIVGRFVFVHGPGRPDQYPPWAWEELPDMLASFLSFQSKGAYNVFFTTVLRPGGNANKTWELPNAVSFYQHSCSPGPCYSDANADIIRAVHDEWSAAGNPSIWDGVERVIMIYENGSCVLFNGQSGTCPTGVGNLFTANPNFPFTFTARGATLGIASDELTTSSWRLFGAVTHEFAHTIPFPDVPAIAHLPAQPLPLTRQ